MLPNDNEICAQSALMQMIDRVESRLNQALADSEGTQGVEIEYPGCEDALHMIEQVREYIEAAS